MPVKITQSKVKTKMKKKLNVSLLTIFAISILFACKKDRNNIMVEKSLKVDEKLVFRLPQTEDEKKLVVNLQKITEIVKDVYKDKEALQVVNAAIQSKIYSDQSILLKDLIYPNEGLLASSTKFKELKGKLNLQYTKFADLFWQSANKMNDTELSNFLSSLKPKDRLLSIDKNPGVSKSGQKVSNVPGAKSTYNEETVSTIDDVSIYYPYAEQYINPFDNSGNYAPATSVMTATADADEGYGWQPVDNGYGVITYNQVIINDDYAELNPTHIIGINGIYEMNPSYINELLTFPPGPPIVVPNLPRTVKQVYIGDVVCKNQYDALISFTNNGGGSEIRFTRSDGFLKVADGQVQADHFIIQGRPSIGRGDIRKKNWLDWTIMWDADWEVDNLEQNLAIYEEDNRNTLTASASVATKLKVGTSEITGTIGVSFNFKSDDDLIRQQNHKYVTFFPLNRGYAGEPTRNGWLIYDVSSPVSFTLPDRTLTQ